MRKQTTRKIIKIEYSRLVSLPLFWLDMVGLDSGDYVKFSVGADRELILKPKEKENET